MWDNFRIHPYACAQLPPLPAFTLLSSTHLFGAARCVILPQTIAYILLFNLLIAILSKTFVRY